MAYIIATKVEVLVVELEEVVLLSELENLLLFGKCTMLDTEPDNCF